MQQLLVLFTCMLFVATDDIYVGTKIAANEHLLVVIEPRVKTDLYAIKYQCSSNREKVTSKNFDGDMSIVGIGKAQNQSQSYFVTAGKEYDISCMSKISINCINDNELKDETVCFNGSNNFRVAHYIVVVDPHGRYAIGLEEKIIFFYDLLSLKHSIINITWPNCTSYFTPYAADISNEFVYVIGYCIERRDITQIDSDEYFKTIVYLLSVDFDNNKYAIEFHDSWVYEVLYTYLNREYSSISVIDDVEEKILVGIPDKNIVHLLLVDKSMKPYRLQHISSKQLKNSSNILYGMSVAWLNQGQKAVVSYDDFRQSPECSGLFLYDITKSLQFIDEVEASSTFPNQIQKYPNRYKEILLHKNLVATSANPSTLYIYSGHILVLLPSKRGYYSTDYELDANFSKQHSLFFLFPNMIPCQPGTYKNDTGIWPCSSCEPTIMNSSQLQSLNEDSIRLTCPQCLDKDSCPLQFVYGVNHFPNIEQNSSYPETLETDVFDDILLYQIFRTDCQWNSPFYVSLICLFVVLFLSILISLLKLYEKFTCHYRHLTKLMQHLDLIGHGQLWFGGLLTIVVFILLGFAVKFSHVYHYQYPIEKQQHGNNDICLQNSQLNAKFETSLQFVGSPPGQHREIFHLLDSQQFTLNIEFINTLLHSGQITFNYADTTDSLPYSSYISGHVLYISTNLSAHNSYLKLAFKGNETIDAIRIGITGSNAFTRNNYLQKLNFSKVFHRTNSILKEYPAFNLQLTKVINITEGLTISDDTTYSGIWLPTFTFDDNQLFKNKTLLNTRKETIISLSISETSFFIRNKQQPIAKRSEIIFKTTIFITICLDFICMTLLLSKLWMIPLIKILICKLFSPTNWLRRLIVIDKISSNEEINVLKTEL